MLHRARAVAVSLLVLSAVPLSSCSAGEPEAASTPTGPDYAGWADFVCTSLTDLIMDVGAIGTGLSVEVGTGDAREQLRTQLSDDLAAAGTSLEAVRSAIEDAPETDDGSLRETLREGRDEVTSATKNATEAAQAAVDATTLPDFLAAAGIALQASSSALTAVEAYATSVTSAAEAAGDTMRTAFGESASCASLREAR